MTANANWRALLDAALERLGGSKTALAEELGVSRTLVSLVCHGKYPGKLDAFAARVVEAYDRHLCPALDREISRPACADIAFRPAPTSSPREMRHWRTCQTCPHKPTQGGQS